MAAGDYNIQIAETDKDFSSVAASFNQMAGSVLNHTKDLEEKARERQEFIDDLSHEMNTPLTSIQGYSEFLLSANATQEQKYRAAQSIYKDARRMREMYNKLMAITFTREHALDLLNINVEELLKNIEESFQLIFIQQKIDFKVEARLKTIKADRVLLQMLLCNLINNSIQAIQSDGSISIMVYEAKNEPVIEVRDNGCGIPRDKIEEVIKPFVRVDKSRSRKTGGAGLGLALVNSIAASHQATLVIESEVGNGTCVKLVFSNTSTM
jgi:signal transduction histidine kinase